MSKVKVIDKLEIVPQTEFILVKVDQDQDEKTSGGIIVPMGALQNKKTQTGVIVAVGPGRIDPQGIRTRVPMDCEVGQKVLFACYIGYPIMISNVEHVIIKHNDVMAVVHEESHIVDDDVTYVPDGKRLIV